MRNYIGTKLVQAEPAWRVTGPGGKQDIIVMIPNKVGAWDSASEVEEGYKVRYGDGYESWSPKKVFEEAYRQTDGLNFGLALEAAKLGYRIARKGWNGKGMYVFLAKEPDFHTDADLSEFEDTAVECGDCLCLRTAQRTLQMGWLASQNDMLADDWYIVDELEEA